MVEEKTPSRNDIFFFHEDERCGLCASAFRFFGSGRINITVSRARASKLMKKSQENKPQRLSTNAAKLPSLTAQEKTDDVLAMTDAVASMEFS